MSMPLFVEPLLLEFHVLIECLLRNFYELWQIPLTQGRINHKAKRMGPMRKMMKS